MPHGWFVVELDVSTAEIDDISGRLWASGVSGIEERVTPTGHTLVVSVPADVMPQVRTTLADRVMRERRLDPDDEPRWAAQAVWAQPVHVGRLEVRAPDATDLRPAGGLTVLIEPGRSFGWGGHPTTRVVLQLLQTSGIAGLTVLDVGTGSGVVAIAAARLGAARVVAIDHDPLACREAAANASRNRDVSTVAVVAATLDAVAGSFDVVVANLDRATLVEHARSLTDRVEPGGRLILSGILTERGPDVEACFPAIRWADRPVIGEWAGLGGVRVQEKPGQD